MNNFQIVLNVIQQNVQNALKERYRNIIQEIVLFPPLIVIKDALNVHQTNALPALKVIQHNHGQSVSTVPTCTLVTQQGNARLCNETVLLSKTANLVLRPNVFTAIKATN